MRRGTWSSRGKDIKRLSETATLYMLQSMYPVFREKLAGLEQEKKAAAGREGGFPKKRKGRPRNVILYITGNNEKELEKKKERLLVENTLHKYPFLLNHSTCGPVYR
ncbi:MAG: hypothetical protein A4E41_01482 [Methanoregulaceae archaeon PtaU1.Bin066]|nr:MAG: hypothetical protein A4E41_01482 [Methanoregulaceae archaeon PtaU1.Bin066]